MHVSLFRDRDVCLYVERTVVIYCVLYVFQRSSLRVWKVYSIYIIHGRHGRVEFSNADIRTWLAPGLFCCRKWLVTALRSWDKGSSTFGQQGSSVGTGGRFRERYWVSAWSLGLWRDTQQEFYGLSVLTVHSTSSFNIVFSKFFAPLKFGLSSTCLPYQRPGQAEQHLTIEKTSVVKIQL